MKLVYACGRGKDGVGVGGQTISLKWKFILWYIFYQVYIKTLQVASIIFWFINVYHYVVISLL